jgi:hypothetical protein
MAAGFAKGAYFTDASAELIVKVESDHFANAQLGWAAPTVPGAIRTGYGGVQPRLVEGRSSTGKRARVIVPTITADVWDEATETFTNKDQDGTVVTYTITGRIGEKRHYGIS